MPQSPKPDLKHPYADWDQISVGTALNEAIADYLDKSRDLHEQEVRLAEITRRHIAPLEEVFQSVQEHRRFRASIFSMFASDDHDFEIHRHEFYHED